ncbi:hypothetical protein HYY75_04690 [bacterium]|nr:hypothetical protein [bacterium]
MKILKHSAFTLLELLISFFILLFVGLIYLTAIRSSAQEADFNEKHFAGILLSQKVIEDLMEETWLNPHGFSTLGVEGNNKSKFRIIDGESIFFTSLENRVPPWDSIDQSEGRIDREMSPLFEQVKDFGLSVRSNRMAPETSPTEEKNLSRETVEFSWKGKDKGQAGNYSNEVILFSPVGRKPNTNTDVLEEVAWLSDATYSQILNSSGGSESFLKELGKIYFVSRKYLKSTFLTNSFSKTTKLKATIDSLSSGPSKTLYETHSQLALAWYEIARESFGVIRLLEPSISLVKDNFGDGTLGKTLAADKNTYQGAFRDFRLIFEVFVGSLRQARAHYQFLLGGNLAQLKGGRIQYLVLLRLIDIYRILAIIPTYPEGLKEYKIFLKELNKFSNGRNPYLKRYVLQEIDFSQSQETLSSKYPNLEGLYDIFEKIPDILGFIKSNTTFKRKYIKTRF